MDVDQNLIGEVFGSGRIRLENHWARGEFVWEIVRVVGKLFWIEQNLIGKVPGSMMIT